MLESHHPLYALIVTEYWFLHESPFCVYIRNGLSGPVSSIIHRHGSNDSALPYLYSKLRLDSSKVPKPDTAFTSFPALSSLYQGRGLCVYEHCQCHLRSHWVSSIVLPPGRPGPFPLSVAILSGLHDTVACVGSGVGHYHGTQNDADHELP